MKKPVIKSKEDLENYMKDPKDDIKNGGRWTDEEDEFILKNIRDQDIEINYIDILDRYIKLFKINRTECAFKTRVQKIAKENDIDMKSKRGISEDEKKYIYDKVKESPFDIKYDEIRNYLNCSEERSKRICLELISSEEQIELCIESMNDIIISDIMETLKHICNNCNCKKYSNMFIWKEKEYCEECYEKLFREEINERWMDIHKYSISKNKICCNICNKNAVMNETIATRFHYDHIDMFNKSDTVCKMVRTGICINEIYNEIDKCQLLCVSCHTLVTKIEHKCGFIRFKQQLSREYSSTNDLIKKEELSKKYSEKYNEFMSKVYLYIKEII